MSHLQGHCLSENKTEAKAQTSFSASTKPPSTNFFRAVMAKPYSYDFRQKVMEAIELDG